MLVRTHEPSRRNRITDCRGKPATRTTTPPSRYAPQNSVPDDDAEGRTACVTADWFGPSFWDRNDKVVNAWMRWRIPKTECWKTPVTGDRVWRREVIWRTLTTMANATVSSVARVRSILETVRQSQDADRATRLSRQQPSRDSV
ncbi:hypothetical protein BDV28DRAFT_124522 [Aspergillus coremiiformis]|uniref:Uncharacterized protein n=1 Tax=Aspergillus coremiiformis TaxID=138285 RepID=A0A5N6Z500_9EURO|nr:hypothetical protein BDV28DRAFT_124522 [Aspergillus coremiiformis]